MLTCIEKLNRTRRRANRSLRVMQLMWMPLMAAYSGWLCVFGYEVAKWLGATMALLVGFGYPFAIGISLTARSVEPFPLQSIPEEPGHEA
jgi:hypothetical protein